MSVTMNTGPVLAERTTLRMGGTCIAELVMDSVADLEFLPEILTREGGTPLVLGQGSNILGTDGQLDLVLIRPIRNSGPSIVSETETQVVVRCHAGIMLPALLGFLARHGMSGMEGMSGIPGSVGGAVAMNAGSYGADVASTLQQVQIFDATSGLRWLTREQVVLGYRHFGLAQETRDSWMYIAQADFVLNRSTPDAVKDLMRTTMDKKKATQPVQEWTAGCVFKNPEAGVSAGMLLDKAGYKGHVHGGVGFSSMHANFLVNHGSGTATQALELLEEARQAVLAQSGHNLELEVKVVPCP